MFLSLASLILLMSFDIGPKIGALIPVQDEDGPWGVSALFGVKSRYSFSAVDLDFELVFAELKIDPDSSEGFDYSMVPITLGLSKNTRYLRYGVGGALYPVEARTPIAEGVEAVWKGTFPGMYLSVGRDFSVGSNTADITAKFNIIDFDGLWIGLSTSFLF